MTWRLDITLGRPEEATGLKQMPIRARTHKTGAGGMSASLIGHSGALSDYPPLQCRCLDLNFQEAVHSVRTPQGVESMSR